MDVKKKDTRYYETLDSNTLNVTDNIVNLINYNSEKYYEYYEDEHELRVKTFVHRLVPFGIGILFLIHCITPLSKMQYFFAPIGQFITIFRRKTKIGAEHGVPHRLLGYLLLRLCFILLSFGKPFLYAVFELDYEFESHLICNISHNLDLFQA